MGGDQKTATKNYVNRGSVLQEDAHVRQLQRTHLVPGAPTSFPVVFSLHIHALELGITGGVAKDPEQRRVETVGLCALGG